MHLARLKGTNILPNGEAWGGDGCEGVAKLLHCCVAGFAQEIGVSQFGISRDEVEVSPSLTDSSLLRAM